MIFEELNIIEQFDYELPDKSHINIKEERIKCPEALFEPNLIGGTENGIDKIINNSILKFKKEERKIICQYIVLSDGNTMFECFPERFVKELKNKVDNEIKEKFNVLASPERKYCTWIGGSIISSIPTYNNLVITKRDYEENGSVIVHQKII